jgi:hypothetical protein
MDATRERFRRQHPGMLMSAVIVAAESGVVEVDFDRLSRRLRR